ncbi:hypothetical protein B0H11DRAFT_1939638 [Mycena galericulata]|nr:hypothetical protein B0H11DRAFT_1939638 [Mycena galericulata]
MSDFRPSQEPGPSSESRRDKSGERGRDLSGRERGTREGRGAGGFGGRRHGHGHANARYKPTDFDMDKLGSTLKQFVRDWSEEPSRGRRAPPSPNLHTLHPYIHSFSNVVSAPHDMLRAVRIPDIVPGGLTVNAAGQEEEDGVRGEFSPVAGDFEDIYGAEHRPDSDEPQAGQWDAVLTCFFIDTVALRRLPSSVLRAVCPLFSGIRFVFFLEHGASIFVFPRRHESVLWSGD